MRTVILLLHLFVLLSRPVAALEITSVVPSTVTTGSTVLLTGGPFASGDTVLVGPRRIVPEALSSNRISFTVPALPAGDYAIAVDRPGGRSPRSFTLRVLLPPPRISRLDPDTLDSCAVGSDRLVSVDGSGFQPGIRLLLDNAVIAAERLSSSELRFSPPLLKAGMHQVQIVNPDNQASLPHGLFFDGTPQIDGIDNGDDRSVEYELIVRGRNFTPSSYLSVNGQRPGQAPPGAGVNLAGSSAVSVQRDSLRYVDCNTLIYTRRPLVRDPHEFTLQVANPGGEVSNAFRITTP